MDPLDFLKQEELLLFFHRKKTEISCMDQPHTFLSQLRDYDLVSEKLYQRVVKMKTKEQKKKGVYEVLDTLEKNQPECVKTFWQCVFEDHIMQLYPTLRLLRNSLMDGSFSFSQAEMESTSKGKKAEGKNEDLKEMKVKKRSQKRKGSSTSEREEGEEEEDQAGTSKVRTIGKKKKKLQKPMYGSPLTKGGREDIWNWPMYKTQLPVTCGDKEAFLHRDKLARGERCIFHQDRWYTPAEFEKLGGKERNKNWKTSIRCRNTPLQKLIQEKHLKSPQTRRRAADSGQMRRTLFPSSPESSIMLSDDVCSEEENSSSNHTDDRSEGGQREELREEEEEEMEDQERDGTDSNRDDGDVDASEFEGNALPVQCGSVSGILQKDRFASGSTGKCIRTEDSWLTPAEFIRLNPDLTDGMWKRHITCRGQPLSYLIQKKILHVHSLLCLCRMCSHTESDLEDQRNDDHCFICAERGELLCCDECPRSFHEDCHLPTPTQGDDWLCTFCVWKKTQEWLYTDHVTERQVLDGRVSENKLQCQYLLLFMLNADEQKIFTTDPCPLVSGYSSVVPRPMWLQKVRENLESRYTLVGEFVSDIRLIFRNCAIFNRNNPEFRDLGKQLGTLFEEEFTITFNIQQKLP